VKHYERWWENNLSRRRAEFATWLADSDGSSREAVGSIVDAIAAEGHKGRMVDVLECGPGTYLDWETVWSQRPVVCYSAVDVTPTIVEDGRARGLDDVRCGSIEALPYPANCIDVVYCRHVLEHLPSYKTALLEMRRVARRAAVAVFWRLDTTATKDVILWNTVSDVPDTYHNMYSQAAISAFLTAADAPHTWKQASKDWLLIMHGERGRV